MTPTTRTQRRRLERAGFASVQLHGREQGWVRAGYAQQIAAQIAAWRDDVDKLLAEPARPRGRPKKA